MEAIKKMEKQEKNTLEIVLKEILQEQQNANKFLIEQVEAVNQLTTTVNSFNELLENLKIIPPPVSTKAFEDITKNGISNMQKAVENQPKNMVRKFQILLFPERDAKLFYKIVFGRWFLWLVIMLFITNLYKWSIHYNDNQKKIKLRQLQTDKDKKAWDYLYFHEGKNIKRLMNSAYK